MRTTANSQCEGTLWLTTFFPNRASLNCNHSLAQAVLLNRPKSQLKVIALFRHHLANPSRSNMTRNAAQISAATERYKLAFAKLKEARYDTFVLSGFDDEFNKTMQTIASCATQLNNAAEELEVRMVWYNASKLKNAKNIAWRGEVEQTEGETILSINRKNDTADSEARILARLLAEIPGAVEEAVKEKLRKYQALIERDMAEPKEKVVTYQALNGGHRRDFEAAHECLRDHQLRTKFIIGEAICKDSSDQVLVAEGKASMKNSVDDRSKQILMTESAVQIENATAGNGGSQLVYLVKGGDLKGVLDAHYSEK